MILTLFCGIAMYFVKFHIIPIVQHRLINWEWIWECYGTFDASHINTIGPKNYPHKL